MLLPKRILALLLVVCISTWAFARQPDSPGRKLVVATRHVPPFAIKGEDGEWSGIAIDLLREIIVELGNGSAEPIELELRELSLKEMLTSVEQGDVDLAAAALTVNFERENEMDFSHPFHASGLGIGVQFENRNGWLSVLDRIFSRTFLEVVAFLFSLLLLSGVLVFFVERRRNPDQFGGGSYWKGVGAGVWWSIVTLTTVGYGDKAPKTILGRAIAVVWMLSGVLIISSFTATLTSALTLGQLDARISGPSDLARVRVATVVDSTSQAYLRARHIRHQSYSELSGALSALDAADVEAVVYDAPLLRFEVIHNYPRLHVLSGTFERQDYAMAMPSGSPLREQVNRAVLRVISKPSWDEKLAEYLGEP